MFVGLPRWKCYPFHMLYVIHGTDVEKAREKAHALFDALRAKKPDAAAGTDQLPQIKNIIVVMMENHSYDNVLGLQRGRGDGFTLDKSGKPTAVNPWPTGSPIAPPGPNTSVRAFPMPNPCQPHGEPYNTWNAFWASYADGANSGFVGSQSGPVSMGYLEPEILPFTNSLAATFPVCDRYFASVGAQTYPNRRFLMAGTSLGLLTDVFPSAAPPNGTIFDRLDAHGRTWKVYVLEPCPLSITGAIHTPRLKKWLHERFVPFAEFERDAAAGTLPDVSTFYEPNVLTWGMSGKFVDLDALLVK